MPAFLPLIALNAVTDSSDAKPSVKCTTTVASSGTYSNGSSGVGAQITAYGFGAFPSNDGVTLDTVGQRILLKDESNAAYNGIYELTVVGDVSTAWVLTRSSDNDEDTEQVGATVWVEEGTTYSGTQFRQTTTGAITMGTTSLDWEVINGTNSVGLDELDTANIPVSSWAAATGTVNMNGYAIVTLAGNKDIILDTHGTGAVQFRSDGDPRGNNAVDLQMSGTSSSMVASGNYSFLAGANSSATAAYAMAMGLNCDAFGQYALALGFDNHATGDNSIAFGRYAHSGYGEFALGGDRFSTNGDAQVSWRVLRGQTTDATQTEIFINGVSSQRLSITDQECSLFELSIVARRQDADDEGAAWVHKCCVDRNGSTTAFVGGGVSEETIADDSSGTWDVSTEIDDTNDALVVKVTGEASKTIRWVVSVKRTKVIG